jgi:hypothetical protein
VDWWVELGGSAGNEKIHGDTAVWGGVKVLTTSPEGESPLLGQVPSVSPNTLSLSYALCPPEARNSERRCAVAVYRVPAASEWHSPAGCGGVPHSTRPTVLTRPSVLFLCPLPPQSLGNDAVP